MVTQAFDVLVWPQPQFQLPFVDALPVTSTPCRWFQYQPPKEWAVKVTDSVSEWPQPSEPRFADALLPLTEQPPFQPHGCPHAWPAPFAAHESAVSCLGRLIFAETFVAGPLP